jgi:D-inositol-3-phosphate glycosyltransferase
VLPEETGLLVPPQDVDAFAGAIGRVLGDELWAKKMRKRASERVQQNFSWGSVAVQLSDLYRRMLAQSLSGELLVAPTRSIGYSTSGAVAMANRTKVS